MKKSCAGLATEPPPAYEGGTHSSDDLTQPFHNSPGREKCLLH
jgi:hypothetical protein